MGARWLVFFKIKTADVSLRDLRATARFLGKPSPM
jgi:hypothetical protein